MPGEQPQFRFEIAKAYEDLASPVEGELRREPIVDADVPCPRCGAREWLLIERRAEPEEPFTRWRALACASCGGSDGWGSAGRARRGRAADRWSERDQETVAGMPEKPTAGLSGDEAMEIVEQQRAAIDANWGDVCDEAGLTAAQRAVMRRVFPHQYALYDLAA